MSNLAAEAADILEKQLIRFDRRGFRRELARALGIRPTEEALQAFANKHPDKWGQLITMLAGLAGFQQGVNITVSGGVDPTTMTDAALLAEVKRLSGEVAARARGAAGEVIDVEVIPQRSLPAPVASEGEGVARLTGEEVARLTNDQNVGSCVQVTTVCHSPGEATSPPPSADVQELPVPTEDGRG